MWPGPVHINTSSVNGVDTIKTTCYISRVFDHHMKMCIVIVMCYIVRLRMVMCVQCISTSTRVTWLLSQWEIRCNIIGADSYIPRLIKMSLWFSSQWFSPCEHGLIPLLLRYFSSFCTYSQTNLKTSKFKGCPRVWVRVKASSIPTVAVISIIIIIIIIIRTPSYIDIVLFSRQSFVHLSLLINYQNHC